MLIRTIGAFVAALVVGLVVAGVGTQLLPELSPRPQASLDAGEGRPFDAVELGKWLDANRRPGLIFIWLILPISALAMGGTGGVLANRAGAWVVGCGIAALWVALEWGSRPDVYDVSALAVYLATGAIGAWAGARARERWTRATRSG